MRQVSGFIAIFAVIGFAFPVDAKAAEINWTTDYRAAFEQARESNRPVILHFWTPSCGPCRQLESTVFKQDRVVESLNELYIPVKVNAEEFPQLAARYQVRSVPQDVIVSPANEVVHQMHTPRDAGQYVAQLAALAFRANGPGYSGNQEYQARRPGVQTASPDRRARGLADAESNVASRYGAPAVDTEPAATQSQVAPPQEVINRFAGKKRTGDRPSSETPRETSDELVDNGREASNDTRQDNSGERYADSGRSRWSGADLARDDDNAAAVSDGYDELPEPRRSSNPRVLENRYAERESQNIDGQDPRESVGRSQSVAPRNAVAAQATKRPPLGMDGFCPVTLLQSNAWVEGDRRFGVTHRGRTYLFKGDAEKRRFLDDPDEYSPVLAGIDPVALTSSGQVVEGDRAFGVVYRRRVYLFSTEENLNQFWEAPEEYASPIRNAMEAGDLNRLFR